MKSDLNEVKSLIDQGENIETRNGADYTPLHTAVWQNEEEISRYLIYKEADVNTVKNIGNPERPIHWAIINGNIPLAKLLKERGAKITQEFWPDELWAALDSNNPAMLEWVLNQKGINPNRKAGIEGQTVLHQAILMSEPNPQMLEILLKYKVDPRIKDKEGKTAIDLLKTKKTSLQAIEKMLRKAKS